ncbi:Dihydrofolate synthase/folylpolyglutamate synthase [Paraconexibacter sp. AEG42_29]|uniref:tetrahydrofolate synthase n=1 Tax=Paraconexibacter sp. AEG42_29 TaxID=2997339 RepID=A0AAU7AXH9_9ACTN
MTEAPTGITLTVEQAEEHLLRLELFGMRFGTGRMRRLMDALGTPQDTYGSVHVVGSNGKTSTTRMIAALLAHHGLRTGAYLSPHLVRFGERIVVDGADLPDGAFAAAVTRAVRAAAVVDAEASADDHVTQFELLTAAALDELGQAGVDVAIIEAGLGGRYDATNVLPSAVQVLTNVGLEHTRWLGPTITDIAGEKLDVVRPGGTLVVGAGLHADALAVAEQVCAERGATLIEAPADPPVPVELLAGGTYQRANFPLACAAAAAYLGRALDPDAVRAAAASTIVPGRWQQIDSAPDTIIDGAHNPAGFVVLADTLREVLAGRRLVAVLSILDDKDAAAMLGELLPLCAEVVCTHSANPRALPPATLQSLAAQLGWPITRLEGDPARALALARELAGPDGLALATGSLYLIADLLRPDDGRAASAL